MIPYGKQDISAEDIEAVTAVLQSDFLTQGPVLPKFETALCQEVEAEYCFAVNSATSALHIACLALGLGPGDWLWTSPNTFVASANCALYCGASVDFVDIEPTTYNMCPSALEQKLIKAKIEGKVPKVVVPVHFAGTPCDMQAIYRLSKQYGFRIIEDASHAIGASFKLSKIGKCDYSDITVFSFHPVKIITTGEGGALTTQDPHLAEQIGLLRSHGITRDPRLMHEQMPPPWYYEQIEVGLNYRMTDIQAALGVSQIKRLNSFIELRHEKACRYHQLLQDKELVLPKIDIDGLSSLHLYVVQLPSTVSRLDIFTRMKAAGIGVNVHYIPVHLQPVYKALGQVEGDFPEAEDYYAKALTLPLHPNLSDDEQDYVVRSLSEAMEI